MQVGSATNLATTAAFLLFATTAHALTILDDGFNALAGWEAFESSAPAISALNAAVVNGHNVATLGIASAAGGTSLSQQLSRHIDATGFTDVEMDLEMFTARSLGASVFESDDVLNFWVGGSFDTATGFDPRGWCSGDGEMWCGYSAQVYSHTLLSSA